MSDGAYVELSLDQGADFTLQINWTDPSNQPYEVIHPIRMQARASTGQVVLDLSSLADGADVGEGTQATLVYSTRSGVIQVNIPYTMTTGVPAGEYFFDMFVTYRADSYSNGLGGTSTNAERRMKLLYGKLTVEGRVTLDV